MEMDILKRDFFRICSACVMDPVLAILAFVRVGKIDCTVPRCQDRFLYDFSKARVKSVPERHATSYEQKAVVEHCPEQYAQKIFCDRWKSLIRSARAKKLLKRCEHVSKQAVLTRKNSFCWQSSATLFSW